MAAETPGQLKQTLLADWWQAFQQGERAAILAYRREEVDQFNTACQQLRQHAGQLGLDRLQVGDRQFAVGDAVVCGKNALRTLGVANGSRGQVLALDPDQRSMTLRLDNGQEATLDGRYLDHRPAWWTRGHPGRRTIDLGYASTGHRSQGVTLDRALVGSPAPRTTSGCMSPPPVPPRRPPSSTSSAPSRARSSWSWTSPAPNPAASTWLTAIARRNGGKRLAVDTATPPALRQMSKRELRAERDQVAAAPRALPDRSRLLAHTTDQRQLLSRLADATAREEAARDQVAELGQGAGRLLRRRELTEARDRHSCPPRPSSPVSRPTGPPTANARPAAPSRSTWHGTTAPGLLNADRRVQARWRGWSAPMAIDESSPPGWASWRATTIGRASSAGIGQGRGGPGALRHHRPRPGARLSFAAWTKQRRHHRAAHQVIERLHERQRTTR